MLSIKKIFTVFLLLTVVVGISANSFAAEYKETNDSAKSLAQFQTIDGLFNNNQQDDDGETNVLDFKVPSEQVVVCIPTTRGMDCFVASADCPDTVEVRTESGVRLVCDIECEDHIDSDGNCECDFENGDATTACE